MKRAYLCVLLATLLFSSMEVVLKGIVGFHGAAQVNCTRFFVGGLFLLPFALREIRARAVFPSRREFFTIALLGFLGIVASMSLYQLAVELAPANVVAVLFCTNAVFVLLFASLFTAAKIQRLQVFAVVFSLIGILCIVNPLHTEIPAMGLFFALASPILFALYSVFGANLSIRYGGVFVTSATFLCGSLETLLLIALGNIEGVAHIFSFLGLGFLTHVNLFAGYTVFSFWSMLYVSIAVSGIGFAAYFLAAQLGTPILASLAFYIKPVLAPFFCFLFLGEAIPLPTLVGIVFLLIGSFCSLWDQRKKA